MQNVQLTGDFLILLILLVPVCLLERHWWSLYPFCIFNTIIVHIGYIFVENGRNVLCLCFYIQFVWSWKINKYNINDVHIDSYAFYMFHILEQLYEKILTSLCINIKGTLPSDVGKLSAWSFSWYILVPLLIKGKFVCVLLNERLMFIPSRKSSKKRSSWRNAFTYV